MKIILNKEEQELLKNFLNNNKVKEIEFETSYIYMNKMSLFLIELLNEISNSYRVGYLYNTKTNKLLFKNDYQKIDEDVFRWLYEQS